MKTIFTLLALFSLSLFSSAQVQCIKCYSQNARVLTDTNNLILNGGFENTTCTILNSGLHNFCPNSTYYTCDIINWICTGGGINSYPHIVDTSTNSISIIVEGTKAAYFGNYFCYTCLAHDTSCLTNLSCEVTGIPGGYPVSEYLGYGGDTGVSLEQTVNGLTLGTVYMLEFWAGGESGYSNEGIFAVDVGFGNIFLKTPQTKPITGIGTRFIVTFTATSFSHIIKFTNWGHIVYDGSTELVLDDVRLFASTEGNNICSTAINYVPANAITTISLNPATNLLTITTTSPQPSQIILFDITSKQLMQQKFSGSATLNIENLAKGVYLYEVKDEKGVVKRGKVVKE